MRAKKHKLNISRITEQALLSVLDYLESQNNIKSSKFLNERSFLKESSVVPRAGLEPATNGDITRLVPANSPFLSISEIIKSIANYYFMENNSSKNIQNGVVLS
jgi:hypothetical protein